MLKQLALATFAAVALSAASAHALPFFGDCPNTDCGMNGTRVDGRTVDAEQPTVNAIILPTGEVLDLR